MARITKKVSVESGEGEIITRDNGYDDKEFTPQIVMSVEESRTLTLCFSL